MMQKSQFIEARENTENVLKKMVVFEDNMTDELNLLAKQALFSAKMEVFIAEAEGVPVEQLSSLAKKVYANPEIAITKEFTLKQLRSDFTETETQTQTKMDDFPSSSTIKSKKIDDIIIDVQEDTSKKPTKQKTRRNWAIRQKIDLEECEIQIEILRPKMRGSKEAVEKEQIETRIK